MEELLNNEIQAEDATQTDISSYIETAELFNQSPGQVNNPLEIAK